MHGKPVLNSEVSTMKIKILRPLRGLLGIALLLLPAMVQAEEIKPLYVYEDAKISGSQLVFEYKPESLYEAKCRPGHITDIMLKPGEEITHIAAGDTEQWLIDKARVNNITHVYVKPVREGIETNLIINTSLHSYRLLLSADTYYHPIVSWKFADEERILERQKAQAALKSLTAPKVRLNFDYRLKGDKDSPLVAVPKAIFDDGTHTYIKMPDSGSYDLPVLYRVDKDKKLSLINYRVKNKLFIADRLFKHGRLSFAKDSAIDFYPTKKKTGA